MKKLIIMLLLASGVFLFTGTSSGATVPKTAVWYGDSLTWESHNYIESWWTTKSGWTHETRAFGGAAPCDWIPTLQDDLATINPSIIGILFHGNAGTDCMRDSNGDLLPIGSQAFYDKYETDLATIYGLAEANGTRVVYFNSVPFQNSAVLNNINTIAKDLAYLYHGISISPAAKNGLGKNGAYTDTKNCLSNETPAMGCDASGKIVVRTQVPAIDAGVHLCPAGIYGFVNGACPTYSSGEYRLAKVVINELLTPPSPKLP